MTPKSQAQSQIVYLIEPNAHLAGSLPGAVIASFQANEVDASHVHSIVEHDCSSQCDFEAAWKVAWRKLKSCDFVEWELGSQSPQSVLRLSLVKAPGGPDVRGDRRAAIVILTVKDISAFRLASIAMQKYKSVTAVDAENRERKRIADDLHDSIAQSLCALDYTIETCFENEDCSSAAMTTLHSQVNAAKVEIRRIICNLAPTNLDDKTLAEALAALCQDLNRLTSKTDFKFNSNIGDLKLPIRLAATVYRIVQEATNNAVKHSNSSEISVRLRQGEHGMKLIVRDNGSGFDPKDPEEHRLAGRHGLAIMRERAEASGGRFRIETCQATGTEIHAFWANEKIKQS